MVTTKRQINTESDKYVKSHSDRGASSYKESEAPSDVSVMRKYNADNNIVADRDVAVNDIRVSADTMPLPSVEEQRKKALPPRPDREKPHLYNEDLMPSQKTQRAAENVTEEKAAELSSAIPVHHERGKLSPRMKVMLFVYVAIALVLAIAVIATGVAISNASAESKALSEQITRQTAQLEQTATQLAQATDPATLRAKAEDLGMVQAPEATETVTLVERTDYPTATPHTNGFDKFADWLGWIFN